MPFASKLAGIFKHYGVLKVFSIIGVGYIAAWSYADVGTFGTTGGFVDPEEGFVIDAASPQRTADGVILTKGTERAIVAENEFQLFCLGVTRASAFFMYPCLIFIFLTKLRATMEFVQHTPISMFTYQDLHELHVYCGWVILVDGVLHTIFHIARWADQGNMYLMFDHFSGISGFIIIICTLLICVPMCFEVLRKNMSYELRKFLHYFFVIFCIALAFHTPLSTIPNGGFSPFVFPALLVWYTVDQLYCYFWMTEKIESTIFHVVPTGVQLTMQVSEKFQRMGGKGGYCYVNFPWIDKTQWHAYSLFENPANPAERQIYIQDLGDWTHDVRMALQRSTHRPVWVQGPFSSPYDSAADYDNQFLIAGGIGITPALSVMRAHKETRRSNLIWSVRDPHMLEFFLKNAEFSNRGWNLVFYTGKDRLLIGNANEVVTSTGALVHVIKARPDFKKLIPNIIYSIESGKHVPEAFVSDDKMEAIQELKDILAELDQDNVISSHEKLNELINQASSLGFLFTDLVSVITGDKAVADLLNDTEAGKVESGAKKFDDNGDTPEEIKLLEVIRRTTMGSEDMGSFAKAMQAHNTSLSSLQEGDEEHDEDGTGVEPSGRSSKKKSSRNFSMRSMGQSSMGLRSRRSMISHGGGLGHGGRSHRFSVATRAWNAIGAEMSEMLGEEQGFKPWENDSTEADKYVKALDPEMALATWGALYCGGKSPLADAAKASTKEYGIPLALESFAW